MSRTIAIRKKRPNAAFVIAAAGSITPSGLVVVEKQDTVHPGVVLGVAQGGIAPSGDLATASSGPSLVTIEQQVSGSIVPGGAVTPVNQGGSVGISTELVAGTITPTGNVAVGIDPATVTILKSIAGSIGPSGTVSLLVQNIIIPLLATGNIAPLGSVVVVKSGPDLITVLQSISGSITPTGAIVNAVTTPGIPITQSADGTITPAGALIAVIDPSTVTLLKSIGGTVTPGGDVSYFSDKTVTKSAAGSVTPVGAVVRAVSGPSFVTILKATAGSIAPSGAFSNVVVPPTIASKDVAAMITPTGTLTKLVSGPSFVTVPKLLSSNIAPTGALTRLVTGPSFVTVPQAVTGSITPVGSVTRVVQGPSIQTVPKSVAGGITPSGSMTSLVNPGSVIGTSPMFVGMGQWDQNDWDRPPQWNTGPYINATPSTILSLLAAAKARGYKLCINLAGARTTWCTTNADGTLKFDFNLYKSKLDAYNGINFNSYITDGTFQYVMVGDELYIGDFSPPIPPSMWRQMVVYTQGKWPTLKRCLRHGYNHLSGSSLPAGGWAGILTAGWSAYLSKQQPGLTPLQYFKQERDGMVSLGIPEIILGSNWLNGGDGSSGIDGPSPNTGLWVQSPTELRACIDAAVQIPESTMYGMYTNTYAGIAGTAPYQIYQDRPDYQSAFQYMKATGLARGGVPTQPVYYTDTGVHIAPYPPPSIPVGGALRDALTTHKVFHLLDNARTQNAEYPALNCDNSVLYFVRGGAGMLGDVTWNVTTSTVQVGNIRGAFGTGPFGNLDGVIWDRSDRRYLYFTDVNAPAQLYRRDVTIGSTVVLKNFSLDPSFISTWSSKTPSSLKVTGIHSSRSQEKFIGIVDGATPGIGAVIWDRLTNTVWNWVARDGKQVARVSVDDIGNYIKIHFTDGFWLNAQLNAGGTITELGAAVNVYGPLPVTVPAGTVNITPGTDIQTVVNANIAGTKYFLRAGTHRRTTQITPKAGDSFYGEPGTIVSGARVLTTFGRSGALWTATGQTQQNAAGGVCVSGTACQLPEDLFYDNVLKTRVATLAEVTSAGKWFFDYVADTVYMFDDPTGHTVEIGVCAKALSANVAGVIIRGIVFEKFCQAANTGAAVGAFSGTGWIIEDCEGRWNHGAAFIAASSCQIRRIRAHHNGWQGIAGTQCSNILIEDSEIDHNVTIAFDPYWAAGGIKIANGPAPTGVGSGSILNNYVHHNGGTGIWLDTVDGPFTVDSNYVSDNAHAGIHHEVSGVPGSGVLSVITNNISARNWWGIMVTNSSYVTVQDNIVFDNTQGGIPIREIVRSDVPTRHLNNVTVNRNTVNMQVGGFGTGLINTSGDPSYYTTHNNVFTNNKYTVPSLSSAFFNWNGGLKTFAQFQGFGQDLAGSAVVGAGGGPAVNIGGSGYLTDADPPVREDNQTNKMWHAGGKGVNSRTFSPPVTPATAVYNHPKRATLTDVYSIGRVSLQAVDEVVYETLIYGGTLSSTWSLQSGEIYKLNWATEQTAQPNKLTPEVVRQGIGQLTKVASLAALTARGQWFYDATAKILYVRCSDGLSPSTKRMVILDWRFGMEEIMMVTTAGVLKGRLCRHFSFVSDLTVDVDAARCGSVSYDGSRVLFTSNWGGGSTVGIYAALTDPRL